jgi:hypothetical protein
MTREKKCELAIERRFTYDSKTGLIYNRFGKISNSIDNYGYIQITIKVNKKTYIIKGHQFAWYYTNKECVERLDHINGIRNDNRISNLRSVTIQQNNWNRLNIKGYYWNKNAKKWLSKIALNNKIIYLGLYNIEQEARNAYLQAKEKYHKL